MLIQCLIEREGDTHIVRLENIRYKFQRNERGDMVFEVTNKEHLVWMLGSTSYRKYQPADVGESPELKATLAELSADKKAPGKAKRKAA